MFAYVRGVADGAPRRPAISQAAKRVILLGKNSKKVFKSGFKAREKRVL